MLRRIHSGICSNWNRFENSERTKVFLFVTGGGPRGHPNRPTSNSGLPIAAIHLVHRDSVFKMEQLREYSLD
jgi:hypothetical protein